MDNLKRTLGVVLAGAALGILTFGSVVAPATAAGSAPPSAAAPVPEASKPALREPQGLPTGQAGQATAAPAAGQPPKPTPAGELLIQVSGRVIHTWFEKPGLRVILAIDGFTVMTRQEQLTARDGVLWFDEEEARKTGKASLGVYAETGVEYKRTGGQIEKYDSVFVVLETGGEISLNSEEALRGKADGTELFLRAKKLRGEYLARGIRETPTGVVPAPASGPKVQPPGVREAGVPQEISIVAQDDVRKVNFTSFVEEETKTRISVWTGGIFVTRGDMEMAADNVVIWTPEAAAQKAVGPTEGSKRLAAEAYFEGHVRINQGHRMLQASQLYYDFERDQALAINTKIHTFAKGRNVPVYYYAKEVRQLAKGIFVGTDARMTTCEFAEPHYDFGAKKLTLEDLTPEPAPPGDKTVRRVRYLGEDVNAEIRGLPVTWWPRLAGDVSEADTALRSLRIENRSNRGIGIATQWHLLKLLGLGNEPPGYDFYLDLDAWSKRGPAIGVESKYERPDYYGQFLSYFINDSGKDSVGGQDVAPPNADRGRATWRHRQYMPQNWELTLEASYISDRNFLHEYFQKEDETGKAQETLLYLKKQEHEQALTILASTRVEDFYTRTEYLPQVAYHVIGHSFWDDHLTYYQDSEVAIARFRPDEALSEQESNAALLVDSIHEVDLPLKVAPFNIVPFVEGRFSYFGDTPSGGAKGRLSAREGVRASTQAWRAYNDVESEFWDLHRLRHINIFDVTAYARQASVPSRDLFPFAPTEDGVQEVLGVDATGVTQLGWRQRFETKRGLPDKDGKQTSVDWLTTDLEATFYNNRQPGGVAPDTGPEFNNLDFRVRWRTTDSTTVWSETLFNTDDRSLERFVIGALITHSPRLSYTIGQRIIPDADSSITFFGFDYMINEKWRVAFLEQYDFDRGTNARSDVVFTRRMHRWLMRVRFSEDPSGTGKFFGVEFQPVGVHEVRLSW